jgi:hypothetical protein
MIRPIECDATPTMYRPGEGRGPILQTSNYAPKRVRGDNSDHVANTQAHGSQRAGRLEARNQKLTTTVPCTSRPAPGM